MLPTFAPASARAFAVAAPIPALAPVTIAIFPSNVVIFTEPRRSSIT